MGGKSGPVISRGKMKRGRTPTFHRGGKSLGRGGGPKTGRNGSADISLGRQRVVGGGGGATQSWGKEWLGEKGESESGV